MTTEQTVEQKLETFRKLAELKPDDGTLSLSEVQARVWMVYGILNDVSLNLDRYKHFFRRVGIIIHSMRMIERRQAYPDRMELADYVKRIVIHVIILATILDVDIFKAVNEWIQSLIDDRQRDLIEKHGINFPPSINAEDDTA